jgi:hypothetical protein
VLHFIKFSKCFLKTFVWNVTWLCASFQQIIKMFMWMLHGCAFIKFSKCLCDCYMAVSFLSSSSQNVYVIVTWLAVSCVFHFIKLSKCLCNCYMAGCVSFHQVLKMFMRILHGCVLPFIKFSKCLCNCYMAGCVFHFIKF